MVLYWLAFVRLASCTELSHNPASVAEAELGHICSSSFVLTFCLSLFHASGTHACANEVGKLIWRIYFHTNIEKASTKNDGNIRFPLISVIKFY
jgi:hypothetical protein